MLQRKTLVSALLASLVALPAFAQDAAPAPAAAPAQSGGIEEIQITARKVSENLQETPLSVSAINAEGLESLGIQDTRDITALAPNAYFTQTPGSIANLALSIRGVGGAEPLLTREQGVAIYMDGAYIARVTGAIMDLVDIERVEILRGPQGTLYGRNATGGAVNFIAAKPTEDFNFTGRLGTGSFSRFEGLARINTGELAPGLAASMSYLHRQKDGYIDNRLARDNHDPGAQNTDAFRIAFGWDASENLRLDYSFDYENMAGEDPAFQLFAVDTANFGIGDPTGFPAAFASGLTVSKKRLDHISLDAPGVSEHTIMGHNLSAEYDFGAFQVKSITTYRKWENLETSTELDGNATTIPGSVPVYNAGILPFDPFGAPFGAFCPDLGLSPFPFDACLVTPQPGTAQLFHADNVRHQDQWSQELQILGDIGESVNYVAGFYYFKENFDEFNRQQFLIPVGFAVVQLATPFSYRGDARSWALFANATYTLPILEDRVSVTGGIRYSKDQKSFVKQNLRCLSPTNLPPCNTQGPTTTPGFTPITANQSKWDNIDWEVTAKFQATESINAYARVATGYKAGGFNLRTSQPTIAPFAEESLLQYEVGVKTRWLDNRVQANIAAFFSDYKDIQTDVFAAGPGGATSITVNGGKAEIPGVELELLAEPFEGVRLNLNYGWIDPKFKSYEVVDNNATTAVCTGFSPPGYPCLPVPTSDDFKVDLSNRADFGYRPDQTLSAGAEYTTQPIGSLGWVVSARIDARWTDQILWSPLDDERASLIQGNGVVGPACLGNSATCQNGFSAFRDVLLQKPYTLLDIRLTVSEIAIGDRGKLRATVYGKNIADKGYLLSGIDFGGLGFAGGIFGEPATWGIDFTVNY